MYRFICPPTPVVSDPPTPVVSRANGRAASRHASLPGPSSAFGVVSTGVLVALCMMLLTACAPSRQEVLLAVRDAQTRGPISRPHIVIADGKGRPVYDAAANEYSSARGDLPIDRPLVATVTAPDYEPQQFVLPPLTPAFPSGKWFSSGLGAMPDAEAERRLELMVTVMDPER